jgi:hypothetical protein
VGGQRRHASTRLIVAQPREDGVLWIHAPKTIVALSSEEAERLASFITGRLYIQRHPATSPAKARFQQVDG